jgi:hypothetical protein
VVWIGTPPAVSTQCGVKRRLSGWKRQYLVGFIELVVPQEPADAKEHALEPIHFAVQPLHCKHTHTHTTHTTRTILTNAGHSREVEMESEPVDAGSS